MGHMEFWRMKKLIYGLKTIKAELFGHSDFIEPEDTWTAWWIDQRSYGKTAADMFKEYTSFIRVFG